MSMMYCENCDKYIDTDLDTHEDCGDNADCHASPEDGCEHCIKLTNK